MSVRLIQQGDGWQVDIRVKLSDGTRYRERVKAPGTSKSAAKTWADKRVAHLLTQGRPKKEEVVKVPTLREFAPRFLTGHFGAKNLKASQRHSIERILEVHLLPRFGDTRLSEISAEAVDTFAGELRRVRDAKGAIVEERAPKTINNILTVLKTIFRRALRWKVIKEMPVEIELARYTIGEPEFYDFDVFERLVTGAKGASPEAHLVVLLGGLAGLRLGEVIALEWGDVDFERRLLTVRRGEWQGKSSSEPVVSSPKGGKVVTLPMTRRLADALAAYRHLRGPRVLYREDGGPLSVEVVKRWIASAERRAGLPVTRRFHILRHTFCSHLAMLGATPKAIQELARHQSLQMTARYMHLSPAAKQHAIELLDAGHLMGTAGSAGGEVQKIEGKKW
jgi:integrase